MTQGYTPPRRTSVYYWLVLSGISTAVSGLLIMLVLGDNYSTCQSAIGRLARGTSPSAQSTCSFASRAHWLGLLTAIVGGAITLFYMVRLLSTRRAVSAAAPCQTCGMPLSAHVEGWCPPCQRCGQPFLAHEAGRCPPTPGPAPGQGQPTPD